jgi:hypothetical protein
MCRGGVVCGKSVSRNAASKDKKSYRADLWKSAGTNGRSPLQGRPAVQAAFSRCAPGELDRKRRYSPLVTSRPTSSSVPPEESLADREVRERFEEAYDESGVDRSLIRWCLSQSVTDRVRGVEETLNALATVRRIERG